MAKEKKAKEFGASTWNIVEWKHPDGGIIAALVAAVPRDRDRKQKLSYHVAFGDDGSDSYEIGADDAQILVAARAANAG